jgi:hypothetical protein
VQDHYRRCVCLLYGTKPPNKEPDEKTKHWQLNVSLLVCMKLCCKVQVQCCNTKQEDPAEVAVPITKQHRNLQRKAALLGDPSNLSSPKTGSFYSTNTSHNCFQYATDDQQPGNFTLLTCNDVYYTMCTTYPHAQFNIPSSNG